MVGTTPRASVARHDSVSSQGLQFDPSKAEPGNARKISDAAGPLARGSMMSQAGHARSRGASLMPTGPEGVKLQGKTMPDSNFTGQLDLDAIRDINKSHSPSPWVVPRRESKDADNSLKEPAIPVQRGSMLSMPDISERRDSLWSSASGSEDDGSASAEDNCYFVDSEDAVAAIQEYRTLDPIVRAAREENFCNSLVVCDLTKSPMLSDHFKRYNLTDFFDERGQRRYQNLSMSFAAKQHAEIQGKFGSTITEKPQAESAPRSFAQNHLSARAYRLATAMVQKDRDVVQQRMKDQFNGLDGITKVRSDDVKQRQQEMLFLEVADYQSYLPAGVKAEQLLPLDVSSQEERHERKRFEKLNACVLEMSLKADFQLQVRGAVISKVQQPKPAAMDHWFLKRDEIFEALVNIASWTSSSGLSTAVGIERAIFCRFVLDVQLVDQDIIPYVWAVSIFDQFAKPYRVSGVSEMDGYNSITDNLVSERPAFTLQLCKWDFISALDAIVRRRHSRATMDEFISTMRRITAQFTEQWRAKEHEAASSVVAEKELAAKAVLLDCSSRDRAFHHAAVSGSFKDPVANNPAHVMLGTGEEEKRSLASESMVWKRNRLINGMLAEPEVLQLVEQFRPVFQDIFLIYTDDPSSYAEASEREVQAKNKMSPEGTLGRDMEFVNFVQFCQDLRIVPCLATMHELWRAYSCAECLDFPEGLEQHLPKTTTSEKLVEQEIPELSPLHQSMVEFTQLLLSVHPDLNTAFSAFDTSKNGELSFTAFKNGSVKIGYTGDFKAIFRELELKGQVPKQHFVRLYDYAPEGFSSEHSGDKAAQQSQRSALKQKAFYNSNESHGDEPNSARLRKGSTRASVCVADLSRAELASAPKGKAGGSRKNMVRLSIDATRFGERHNSKPPGASPSPCGSPAPWVYESEDLKPPPAPPPQPKFGVGAFVESLCRIALTHLMVHGNSVQLATGSRAKMVWLLAYLQATLEHLRQSVKRRKELQSVKKARPNLRRLQTAPANSLVPGSVGGVSTRTNMLGASPGFFAAGSGKGKEVRQPVPTLGNGGPSASPATSSAPSRDSSPIPPPMQGAEGDAMSSGVSARLTAVLLRLTPEAFEAMEPMELQLDSYSPQRVVTETIEVDVTPIRKGSDRRGTREERVNQKKERRKSRHQADLGSELALLQATANVAMSALRPVPPTSPPSDNCNAGQESGSLRRALMTTTRSAPAAPGGKGPGLSLKDAGRKLMLQSLSAKKFGSNNSLNPEEELPMGKSHSTTSRKKHDSVESKDSDEETINPRQHRRGSHRAARNKKFGSTAAVQSKEEVAQGMKEDLVQMAIDSRPEAPKLRDDSFKFRDLLFKRLLQPALLGNKGGPEPTSGLDESFSPPCPIKAAFGAMLQPSAPANSRRPSVNPGSHALQSPKHVPCVLSNAAAAMTSAAAASTLPSVTTLSKDRGNLIKGLGTCIGRIDRCTLSPPPMNSYAVQLNERIENMMSASPEETQAKKEADKHKQHMHKHAMLLLP